MLIRSRGITICFAFFMCIPELIMTDGKISLIASINETETVVNGIRMGSFVERLGTSGIFTAIIMSIIAVELYCMCVKRNWVIKCQMLFRQEFLVLSLL